MSRFCSKKAENEATIQTIRVQLEQLEDVNEEEILKEKSRMTEEKSQMAEAKKRTLCQVFRKPGNL